MSKPKKNNTKHRTRAQYAPAEPVRKPQQELVSVPAKLVEHDRKNSHLIIDTLAKTALAIGNSENAGEQLSVIKELWTMQKEAEDRQAEREFNIAKVMVSQELPPIPRSGKREFIDKNGTKQESDYSTLDDIEGVLGPICRKYGLDRAYSSRSDAKGWACQVLVVRHISGHKEVYESPYMPLDTSGSKNNQQGAGSVAKYGRRYAVIGAFNIYHVDEDNDGATLADATQKDDKFGERAREAANKDGGKGTGATQLSLPEAAEQLESKLRNLPQEKRAEALMKHISIIDAMQKDEQLAPKAAELRKLCEEKPGEES